MFSVAGVPVVSFLLVATTVCDAQNAMSWYVAYQRKEPRVYALKYFLVVLRATNQALCCL